MEFILHLIFEWGNWLYLPQVAQITVPSLLSDEKEGHVHRPVMYISFLLLNWIFRTLYMLIF